MTSITFLKPSLTKLRAITAALALTVAPLAGTLITAPAAHATTSLTRLQVSSDNSRYFQDQSGKIVYLVGEHTWQNLQDLVGAGGSAFDYDAYTDLLQANHMNLIRLWTHEESEETRVGSGAAGNGFEFTRYNRVSGHGTGNDGQNKFDLSSLNQDYFDRLRDRAEEAGEKGLYAQIMLFNGWSVECKDSCDSEPWTKHPYNAANNINSVDGDSNADGQGPEVHTLSNSTITAYEDAYVEKVIDTIGDLPNIIYEVSNESQGSSTSWQYHMIDKVHSYETTQYGYNHPVGMSIQYPGGNLTNLTNSDAEWVSFGGNISSPSLNTGTKVVIADTDHVCGTCSNTEWGWRSLTRGQQQSYMDPYDMDGHSPTESGEVNMRTSLKYVEDYSSQIDLKHAVPSSTNTSTGYALVNDGTTADDQYMVYAPDGGTFTVNLANTSHSVVPQWLNTDTYATSTGSAVAGGGSSTSFTSPWGTTNSALLVLKEIDTTNPTVSLTAPTAGSVSGTIALTATASDNRGVAGVQFKVDGSNVGSEDTAAPYSVNWDTTLATTGSHTVTAVARDTSSNTATSSGVSVSVNNGDSTSPTVSLTAPSAGLVSGSVTVSASASDNVGVSGVQFKLDGANLGAEDTSSPYSISWNTALVPEGTHSLTAVARDTATNTATSSAVSVTVHNYSGLVAAYGFDNNASSSTRLYDGSGNGYNLSCGTTCATYTASGGHGSSGAYDFTGSGDWLQTSVETPFDFSTNMTVEYWMKTATWGGSWISLVTKGDTAWTAGRYGGYDSPVFSTYNGSTYHDARSGNYTTEDLNDGAWHHVALTYDGTYKKVYVDGTLTNTYSYSQALHNNGYPLSLGYNLEYTPAEYSGFLDDVRVYSRALTGTEIGNDMTTPVVN